LIERQRRYGVSLVRVIEGEEGNGVVACKVQGFDGYKRHVKGEGRRKERRGVGSVCGREKRLGRRCKAV
jgi:hypothetical protein